MANIERVYDQIRREERAALQRRVDEAYRREPELAALADQRRTVFLDAAAGRLAPDAAGERLRALDGRERDLLRRAGLAPDALQLHYRCAACRDTGYLGNGVRRPCACRLLLGARLDPAVGVNERETFEAFDVAVYPTERQKKEALAARKHCEAYAAALPRPPMPNLLLMGMTGLGKSYLGNAIAYRALGRGVEALRATAYGFVQDTLDGIRGENRALPRYRSIPLLVLDDLGTEPLIPNVTVESLFAVVNERAARGLATVMATNLAFAALQGRYGERLFSRLTDGTTTRILRLTGDSLRRGTPAC